MLALVLLGRQTDANPSIPVGERAGDPCELAVDGRQLAVGWDGDKADPLTLPRSRGRTWRQLPRELGLDPASEIEDLAGDGSITAVTPVAVSTIRSSNPRFYALPDARTGDGPDRDPRCRTQTQPMGPG